MITSWDIYFITRLDPIRSFFTAILAFLSIATVIFLLAGFLNYLDGKHNNKEGYRKLGLLFFKYYLSVVLPIFFVSLISIIFIPSIKDAVAIYAIPKMANNEDMQKIPANFAKLVNKKLQEWMEDAEIATKAEIEY